MKIWKGNNEEHKESMLKFKGKKILLLGSSLGTLDIIKYAKKNGAVTILADNLPVDKSIGKQFADENVLISTADIEALKKYVKDNEVDGIFAGISEFNLLKAMELCQFFRFPFYCTKEQWDIIADKERFRNLCVMYDVPSPKTYYSGDDVPREIFDIIQFPVIVKPVDSTASVGISICENLEDLNKAIPFAIKNSGKKRIIVEEFFEGEEFTAHYSIVNGEVSLTCIDNRVPIAVNGGFVTTVPLARIYPSTFIVNYIEQVNDKMMALCKSLKLNTGVLFVQGLYNRQSNKFSIFEAGLRCAGEVPYHIIEKVNGLNFMNNFVDYALSGKVLKYDISKEDPFFKGKSCCVTSFVSKGGTVGRIIGYNEIQNKVKSIINSECRYKEGDVTPSGNTLHQIMLRFVLVCDNIEQMIRDVEIINNSVKVLDEKGDDLCYRFDVKTYMDNVKVNLS